MGKWAARLDAATLAAPRPTVKTDERGVLAVLAGPPKGVAADFQASPIGGELRGTLMGAPGASPDLVAWTDSDIHRFLARRARLVRWGWVETEAEALAERLVIRDRTGDDRTSCTECHHHRPGQCGNHRAAGLHSPEVGRDLAAMLQRCPGHQMTR